MFGLSFRIDRAVTVGLVNPLTPLLKRRHQVSIPILMYHSISDPGDCGRHPYFATSTSPAVFAQHMRLLAEHRYTTVDLADAVNVIADPQATINRQVVITFDDGYRDFFTTAFPILREYGFKATVFIVSGFTGDVPVTRNGMFYMTWDDVREVQTAGIQIGSHTITHPELHTLPTSQVEHEIRESARTIEGKLGSPVRSFSYPYSFPEQSCRMLALLRDSLQKSGYENGVSTIIGTAVPGSDPFALPRLPVNSYDDSRLFLAKLAGAYDWLHVPQLLYKTCVKPHRTTLEPLGSEETRG